MTNNINLVELLKDCKNQIFWSDLFGDVTVEIKKDPSHNDYPIIIKPVDSFLYETLNQFGQISNTIKDCPCILWPSEDNKSWENFKKPVTLKVGKRYKSADGNIYQVMFDKRTLILNEVDDYYMFALDLKYGEGIFYTIDGKYFTNSKSDYDLIEEL